MPTYIIKPSRDEDFYVWWSTIVDAPVAWGPRDDSEPAERWERADERGTSANWTDWPIEKMPYRWDCEPLLIREQPDLPDGGEGWWYIPRANLREFCRRLDAGEPIRDLVTWEADDD